MNKTLLTLILALSGCGKDHHTTTVVDRTTENTIVQDSLEFKDVEIGASRTYNPSSWDNRTFEVEKGFYELPLELEVLNGNSGTGWASVIVGDLRYCYQGNALNNNTLGTSFSLKGQVNNSFECFQKTPLNYGRVLFIEKGTIEIQVNGGGCGSICANTEVGGSLKALVN